MIDRETGQNRTTPPEPAASGCAGRERYSLSLLPNRRLGTLAARRFAVDAWQWWRGVYHFFEHVDTVPAMTGIAALDDLVLGWPMALGLTVGAAIVYGK